ncbi:phosphatidylinositol-glycan biosynthesis class F protein isoform X2 [Panulirus ornatus]|uniref:phosphatidylinositol-glycan biosynthesis class F protein isoform X2 n=1 Tax=Panulirus ornatus TaxID=150431 RepID=UPI003A864963
MVSREQSPPIFLTCKHAVNFILAAGLLCFLVQSGYQRDVCLHALRIYSLSVIGIGFISRLLQERAVPGRSGPSDGYICGLPKGKTKKSSKVVEVVVVALLSICSIIFTHVVTVLFGAYVIENVEETFTFSILVASLAFIRPLVTLGPSAFIIILERLSLEEESDVKCCSVLFGAWLGAIPIPLDWDTPWQVWPFTCSIGAVLGEMVATLCFLAKLWTLGDLDSKKNKAT